jgi:hypothetical protein
LFQNRHLVEVLALANDLATPHLDLGGPAGGWQIAVRPVVGVGSTSERHDRDRPGQLLSGQGDCQIHHHGRLIQRRSSDAGRTQDRYA